MDIIRSDCDFEANVTRSGELFGGQKYVEVRSVSGHSTLSFPVHEQRYRVGECVSVHMAVFEDGEHGTMLYTSIRKKPDLPKPAK